MKHTLMRYIMDVQGLSELEKRSIERLEATVRAEGFRFRPSLVLPAVHCGSQVVGQSPPTSGFGRVTAGVCAHFPYWNAAQAGC